MISDSAWETRNKLAGSDKSAKRLILIKTRYNSPFTTQPFGIV